MTSNAVTLTQIHCQGGKGRSGAFCSSLLLWNGFCSTAVECLEAFQQRRTDQRIDSDAVQGVAAPCQVNQTTELICYHC